MTSKLGGSHHAPQTIFALATKTYECDRKRAEIPIYSFEKHARVDKTTAIYSPHVLVVEGIFALHDPRVLELLDMKVRRPVTRSDQARHVLTESQIYCEADADTCLSRRILRDVEYRGRTVEGVIKQWFMWVKPNFENVGAYFDFEFRLHVTCPANIFLSMSIRRGRMRMLLCRRGLKTPSQLVCKGIPLGKLPN